MGGSQVASGRGMTGVHYNPAALAFIKGSEVFYSKSYYLADISHNTLAYGTRLSPTDYFGVAVSSDNDTIQSRQVAEYFLHNYR